MSSNIQKIVVIISSISICFWGLAVWVLVAALAEPMAWTIKEVYLILMPFAYFTFCFLSSFFTSKRILIIGGAVAHLAIIPLASFFILFFPISCLFLLCPLTWLFMLLERVGVTH